ncbi:hypothetical protein DVH24_004946 [Malus domestica]|uniref:Uncharacterized protein n=1 Tax=Malus domestica TaxID=3750 RepID=A0A498IFV9_MALDO|nr:hypothetical protein DVH24_004946 [Malus domestica]
MMWMMGLSIQSLLDLAVAGVLAMVRLGIFAFIASILCSATFFHTAQDVSSGSTPRAAGQSTPSV